MIIIIFDACSLLEEIIFLDKWRKLKEYYQYTGASVRNNEAEGNSAVLTAGHHISLYLRKYLGQVLEYDY